MPPLFDIREGLADKSRCASLRNSCCNVKMKRKWRGWSQADGGKARQMGWSQADGGGARQMGMEVLTLGISVMRLHEASRACRVSVLENVGNALNRLL